MSLGLDDFLLYQHRTTNRAVLPFGQPRLGARRLHSLVHDLGVPLGRNNLLFHQHRTTYGAMLSFRQARLSASRLHSRVNDFRMPSRLDLRQAGENLAADAALCPRRTAGLGTGRFHLRHRHSGVPRGADRLRLGRVALSTSIRFHAGSCAGRRGGDFAAVPAVPLGGHNRLLHQHLVAHRAVLPFRQTRLSTRRLHGLVDNLGMSLGRNDFLLHQHRITNRAVLPFGQPRLGTRRLHCLVHDLGVRDGCVPRGELRVDGDAGIIAAPPGQFIVMRLVRRFYRVRRHSRSTIANRLPRENGAVLIPERHLEEGILHLAGRSAHIQRDGPTVSADSRCSNGGRQGDSSLLLRLERHGHQLRPIRKTLCADKGEFHLAAVSMWIRLDTHAVHTLHTRAHLHAGACQQRRVVGNAEIGGGQTAAAVQSHHGGDGFIGAGSGRHGHPQSGRLRRYLCLSQGQRLSEADAVHGGQRRVVQLGGCEGHGGVRVHVGHRLQRQPQQLAAGYLLLRRKGGGHIPRPAGVQRLHRPGQCGQRLRRHAGEQRGVIAEFQLTGSQPLAAIGAGGDAHLLTLVQRGHAAAAIKIQRLGGGLRLRHREHAGRAAQRHGDQPGVVGVFDQDIQQIIAGRGVRPHAEIQPQDILGAGYAVQTGAVEGHLSGRLCVHRPQGGKSSHHRRAGQLQRRVVIRDNALHTGQRLQIGAADIHGARLAGRGGGAAHPQEGAGRPCGGDQIHQQRSGTQKCRCAPGCAFCSHETAPLQRQ